MDITPANTLIPSLADWQAANASSVEEKGYGNWFNVGIEQLDDFTKYHLYFPHDKLNATRDACYASASAAQLIGVDLAIAQCGMIERAFRARHASIIQHYAHAKARSEAQSQEKGIFKVISSYLQGMIAIPPRS